MLQAQAPPMPMPTECHIRMQECRRLERSAAQATDLLSIQSQVRYQAVLVVLQLAVPATRNCATNKIRCQGSISVVQIPARCNYPASPRTNEKMLEGAKVAV